MSSFNIEYKANNRCLVIQQINNLFKIISLSSFNQIITKQCLETLLNISIEVIQNTTISSSSSSKDSNTLPKDSFTSSSVSNNNDLHRLSPVSVSYVSDDSNIIQQLYNKKVISMLKQLFFTCDEAELSFIPKIQQQLSSQQQQPILISIEGNIGAGKSKFLLIYYLFE